MNPEPTPRPRGSAAQWAIVLLLVLILACGSCGFLSLFTAVGRAFWQGFNSGLGL